MKINEKQYVDRYNLRDEMCKTLQMAISIDILVYQLIHPRIEYIEKWNE